SSLLTSAPREGLTCGNRSCQGSCTGVRGERGRTKPGDVPPSVTNTCPDRSPSSSVKKLCVALVASVTIGKIVRLSCVVGGRTLYDECLGCPASLWMAKKNTVIATKVSVTPRLPV